MAGIFASHDAGVSFLEPVGGGRFTIQTVSTHAFPTEFGVGDINGDGLADVVIVDSGGNSLQVVLRAPNGAFEAARMVPTVRKPNHVLVADGNADRRADLFIIGQPGAAVQWQAPDGTYGEPVMLWTIPNWATPPRRTSTATARSTVVANGGRGIVALLHGLGDGTFELRRSYPWAPVPANWSLPT
jgi:hypothetical protein